MKDGSTWIKLPTKSVLSKSYINILEPFFFRFPDQRRFGQEDHPVRCGTIGKPLSEDKPIPPSEQRQVDDDRIGGADIHEILRMVSQLAGVGAPELPPSSL